jgi:hypothetical protein
MDTLPVYIYAVFTATLLLTITIFFIAINKSRVFILFLLAWLLIQTIAGISGFYTARNGFPPRFLLLILPPLVLIIVLFTTRREKLFINAANLPMLTIIHIIRIPVELVLFWLYSRKAVPGLMTFEGRNPDILSGISAPFIYYFGFVRKSLGRNVILLWNYICLGLLINIVVNAVLSAPTPFQQFAFDQPNIAILHFPFIFLPAVLVPMILYAHLAAIRQLRGERRKE